MEEVLINACYGGFAIPEEVTKAIFELHPPHTEEGTKFFERSEYSNKLSEVEDPERKDYIFVERYEVYYGDYKLIQGYIYHPNGKFACRNSVTRGDGIVWNINSPNYRFQDIWRTHPDVIRLCREGGWIGEKFGYTKLRVAHYPKGYGFDIDDYDGMESIIIEPPIEKVLQDLLDMIKGPSQDKKAPNPFTEKLLKGEITVSQFLRPEMPCSS